MRRWLRVACLPAVATLMVAPALATGSEYEGFYIELGAALATPGNTNTAVAAVNPTLIGALAGQGLDSEIIWTDWDDTLSSSFGFGYSWGAKGRLQVTYWEYSDNTREEGGAGSTLTSYPWMTIGPVSALGYGYLSPALYGMEFEMTQEIEASTIDVEYLRSVSPGESLEMTWGFGLRFADFEDNVDGNYLLDPNDILLSAQIPVFRKVTGDGTGLTGGVGVEYQFTDPFGVRSHLRLGFLTAEVEAEHGWDLPGGVPAPFQKQTIEDETAVTVDFDLAGRFGVGDYVDLEVGWFYTSWWDMAQVPLSRGELRIGGNFPQLNISTFDIPGESRDRITWSGPRIAVDIRFGK